MADQIDYGQHAPASIEYGQHRLHNDTAGKPPASVEQPGLPDTGIMGALFTPIRGVQEIVQGAQRTQNPAEGETRGGIADMLHGFLNLLTPYLPEAIVAAPGRAALGLIGSQVGGKAAGVAADIADASPGARQLAEEAGTIVGAGAGALGGGPQGIRSALHPIKAVERFSQTPGGGQILSGAANIPIGAGLAASGNPIWGGGMAVKGAVDLAKGFGARSAAEDELAAAQVRATAGVPQKAVKGLAGERTVVSPPMPEKPGLPPAPSEVEPPYQPTDWAKEMMRRQRNPQAAVQTSGIPAGVDPAWWAKMTPEFQQALRQKLEGGAPAPAAPYSLESYGVTPSEVATHPDPAVRAAPEVPPPTGPQTSPEHPALLLPRTVPINKATGQPSTALSGMAYHPETQSMVTEHLPSGKVVVHSSVSPEEYQSILDDESPGQAFNQFKKGRSTAVSFTQPKPPSATLPETASPTMEQRLAASPDALALRQEVMRRAAAQHLGPADLEALVHKAAADINTARAAGGNAAGTIPEWVIKDVLGGLKR